MLPIIYDPQATFAARLIFELEAALLRHFRVERASDLRWDVADGNSSRIIEALACGALQCAARRLESDFRSELDLTAHLPIPH